MKKVDYAYLHYLLAKLKYEVQINMCETEDEEYLKLLRKQSDAIDDVMKIFIVECE